MDSLEQRAQEFQSEHVGEFVLNNDELDLNRYAAEFAGSVLLSIAKQAEGRASEIQRNGVPASAVNELRELAERIRALEKGERDDG